MMVMRQYPMKVVHQHVMRSTKELLWRTTGENLDVLPEYWAKYINPYPLSHEFKSLVVWMLKRNPADRPTFSQIRGHPFFTNPDVTPVDELREQMNKSYLRIN